MLGATRWLAELPGVIAGLEQAWDMVVGDPYPDSTEAFVARATASGRPVVLKIYVAGRHESAQREATALRLASGQGCAALVASDTQRGALLLERLGPSMASAGLTLHTRLEILVDAARAVWRPVRDSGLPTGADKGRRLARSMEPLWEELDRPCGWAAVRLAVACAVARADAHTDAGAVLVHGDVHQWNALRAARAPGGYKLVDPDGLIAERECDLGVLMREDPADLSGDGWDRARWLADRTGTQAQAIWQWGAAERVATGLLLTRIGLQPVASEMLAAAERVAERAVGQPTP